MISIVISKQIKS